jgi:hypothetical protein
MEKVDDANILYEQLAELNSLFEDKGTFDINCIKDKSDHGHDWVIYTNDDNKFDYPVGLNCGELYIGMQLMISMIKYLRETKRLYMGKMIE